MIERTIIRDAVRRYEDERRLTDDNRSARSVLAAMSFSWQYGGVPVHKAEYDYWYRRSGYNNQ